MPELPEVETVRRGLAPHLLGAVITRFETRRADLRAKLPRDLATRVTGRRVDAVGRRAKYLLIELDSRDVLIVHLGMSGRLIVGAPQNEPPGKHEHIAFRTDRGVEIRYTDPRRFGMFDILSCEAFARDRRFAELGPEPFSNAFSGAHLAAELDGSRTTIKAALLDQRVVAGLGNIYVCEALYRAGISPLRRAGSIKPDRLDKLASEIRVVLDRAIAAGGSSARDYVQASGEAGWFQHEWAVYDREGRGCPGCDCKKGVRRVVQAGRSSFYCARRQR
jgi:formamidopyrimidine-DNA glycosylase